MTSSRFLNGRAVYWWGFALPIPPMFAVARTIAILLAWRALTMR
jgi:hypothetical protein